MRLNASRVAFVVGVCALVGFGCNATKDLDDVEVNEDRIIGGGNNGVGGADCDRACRKLTDCGYLAPEDGAFCRADCSNPAAAPYFQCINDHNCAEIFDFCLDEGGGSNGCVEDFDCGDDQICIPPDCVNVTQPGPPG